MKKGISLIVLVITIIIVIILAGAVILNLSNNNPVEMATEAKNKSNIMTEQEAINLAILNSQLERYNTSTNIELLYENLRKDLNEIVIYKESEKTGRVVFTETEDTFLVDLDKNNVEYKYVTNN